MYVTYPYRVGGDVERRRGLSRSGSPAEQQEPEPVAVAVAVAVAVVVVVARCGNGSKRRILPTT